MMRKNWFKLLVLFMCIFLTGCEDEKEVKVEEEEQVVEESKVDENTNLGLIVDSIEIVKKDSNNYEFVYNGETFKVVYYKDVETWKVFDSYKITNSYDLKKICQALIDINPIHGADMVSYRTSDDMAYEWMQHNLAYQLLPEGNSFKESAKDVDLDPKDQGKTLVEMYEDRTGKKLDLSSLLRK